MRQHIPSSLVAVFCLWVTLMQAQAQTTYYYLPTSGTGSWFTASDWNTNPNGTGASAVPGSVDTANIQTTGVCSLDAGSNAVIHQVNVSGNSQDPLPELIVENGATLTVNDRFLVANGLYGRCVLKGNAEVLNNANQGFYVGAYTAGQTSSYGEFVIDGGVLDAALTYFTVGGVGTGVLSVVNGGVLNNGGQTFLGGTSTGVGTILLEDGGWTNGSSVVVGGEGRGLVIMNGGTLTITNTGAILNIGQKVGSEGFFYLNDGEVNLPVVQRERFSVGGSGGAGTFVQNGGSLTAIGLMLGNATGGTGTAILSNGVFNARPTHASWPAFSIFDGSSLVMAGGAFTGTSVSAAGQIYTGGTLELRGGSFSIENTLFVASNATIRVVGPLCDFSTSWWRGNSVALWPVHHSTLELILTKDAGHLAPIKSMNASACALPGTMKVGFEGGACLLATNRLTSIWSGATFDYTYVDPANYGLALWDVGKVDVPTGGDNLDIVLKPAASQGTVSLATISTISVDDKAYGHVTLTDLDRGMLPRMSVTLGLTEVDGTVPEILANLQAAGYPHSFQSAPGAITIQVPAEDITTDTGYFAWDFTKFDGSTQVTVNAIGFQYTPDGTVIVIK